LRSGAAKVCPQCGEIKPISGFKDRSLVTGFGRFCLECKAQPSSREYVSTSSGRRVKLESEPSRSDVNKLGSFSEYPEKYAWGASRAKEKVEYLESIKHKFSEGQLATYNMARKKYDARVVTKKESSIQKTDYSTILGEAFSNHRSVKIRYKGSWRTVDPYSLNKTYIVAYCHLARDIRTFRVDRIQGVELSESFSFDKSLQNTAQERLIEAPNYKALRRRRY